MELIFLTLSFKTSLISPSLSKATFVNEIKDLDVTFDPVDASIRDILWQTKDSYVATVDASGVVTAKDYGKTVITATTKNGKSATCIINVTK